MCIQAIVLIDAAAMHLMTVFTVPTTLELYPCGGDTFTKRICYDFYWLSNVVFQPAYSQVLSLCYSFLTTQVIHDIFELLLLITIKLMLYAVIPVL